MTRVEHFRFKNSMLAGNLLANAVGSGVAGLVILTTATQLSQKTEAFLWRFGYFFDPGIFLIICVMAWVYERPIRRYQDMAYHGVPPKPEMTLKAHQRLLNEPFFLLAVDFGIWLMAAMAYTGVSWIYEATPADIQRIFYVTIQTGLMTTVAAFFILQRILQKRMVPRFFPNGRLYKTPKILRIRISTRLFALLFACNLVPLFVLLNAVQSQFIVQPDANLALKNIQSIMYTDVLVFMGVGLLLTLLVSSNLSRPLQEIISVLKEVRHGQFERKIRVTTNDEIGYAGDAINEMTQGLKERDFINETFGKYVTREIRDEILAGRIPLNGQRVEATLLFSDLRNFTAYVEEASPEEIIISMREYFTVLQRAIRKHQGLVLQFVGDEIEAVFGVPMRDSDHAARAVRAALEMRKSLEALNQKRIQEGRQPFKHGIGIHTGEVLAGNVGSEDRLSYALIGDTVNLASRIETLTKAFACDILASEETVKRLDSSLQIEMERQSPCQVKGHTKPVVVYKIL